METPTKTTDGHYSIVSPGTIHPNSTYNVAVSLQDTKEAAKIKLVIKGADFDIEKEVEVQPMSTQNIEFLIPDIKNGKYTINAEGVSGLIFKESSNLNYDDNNPSVFVQTDKATYKPGDLIHFRVLLLDKNIRPASVDKSLAVYIRDAAKNLLKQFNDAKWTKGVFSGKLQLSEFPVLGTWQIEVLIDGAALKTKTFEVDKYVLPKFEVTIDAPTKISISESKLGFTVHSKYTFGKYVKGKAIVMIQSFKANDSLASQGRSNCCFNPCQPHNIEKSFGFEGKAYIEFKMDDLLPDGLLGIHSHDLEIKATVEEELTGTKLSGSATVAISQNRFVIKAPSLNLKYDVKKKFEYLVTVTNLNGEPICDDKNPVSLTKAMFGVDQGEPLKAFLNKLGIATFQLDRATFKNSNIKVEYQDESSLGSIYVMEKSVENKCCGLHVKPNNAKLGEKLEITLSAEKKFTYFIYAVVARGNIIKSEFLSLSGEGSESHTFYIETTFEMMPSANIYVHYVENNDLIYHEIRFDVEKQFLNKITIDAPEQTKPGEEITLKVDTDVDSFVGLMGVDQSVLLLKSGNDFEKDEILQNLGGYTTSIPNDYRYIYRYPGRGSGLITMTNAQYDKSEEPRHKKTIKMRCIKRKKGNADVIEMIETMDMEEWDSKEPLIRKDFLENWFYDDFESSQTDGLRIIKTVPDTITSWIVTGFSLNPGTGFALTESPTKIKTFRPFFISTNLPYSIKRGEIVTIPIVLFNYLDKTLEADVTLDNSDDEFEFVDTETEQSKRLKHVCVESNNGETINFIIRPKYIGHITLKVKAVSPLAGDAMHKELKVEPEGITIYKNRDYYLHVDENAPNVSTTVKFDIPEDIVKDSEHIEVAVMGDILGSTITNMDKLVRMPYGCGEQNMINFVPNILVLRYLESINQKIPSIEAKAKGFLEIGYQRELTYKHDDGSYSAFGKSDKAGSTWLTAYVMRSFHQAAKYTDIDTKILEAGLEFLAGKQSDNGSFIESGKLFDFSHFNEVGLTAFVLLAFLENVENIEKYKRIIDRGFLYLEEKAKSTDDLYALSIALYALQLRKVGVVYEIMTKLEVEARIDGGLKWWSSDVAEKQTNQPWRPQSHDVEITGYILMTLLDMNESVLPITKWLISQRNSNGGFTSTQETVVGLQALIKFAEKSRVGSSNMTIEVGGSDDNSNIKKFEINKENSMTVQIIELPNDVREIKFNGKGLGTCIVQISYRYNIVHKEVKPSFKLTTTVKPETNAAKLLLNVSAEYLPGASDKITQSNMVVMEVSLPSGYTAVTEAFEKIKAIEDIKRVETKNGDTCIVIYFDTLKKSDVKTVPIEAELSHKVAEQKPAPILIYDYYDSQKRATDFYQISA